METEKKARTKKTERKKTAKKATKERAKRKRTKDMGKKATTKETTTEEVIRIKDVRELVDYCKQLGRKPFQGASIDFIRRSPPTYT